MNKNIYLYPGDIVFTQSSSLLGKLIRKFTQSKGESKTQTNHVGIIASGGYVFQNKFPQAFIIEALTKVKFHSLYKAYVNTNVKICIYRPKNLTFEEKVELRKQAESYIGKTYGYFKIVLHLFDWVIGGSTFFRRLAVLQKYPICSYLVAKVFQSIDKDFGIKARFASPDDILDFCQTNTSKYKQIIDWLLIEDN